MFCIYFAQCAGKYTVLADLEKGATQELAVKSGDVVQLVKEGDAGQWWDNRAVRYRNMLQQPCYNHIRFCVAVQVCA